MAQHLEIPAELLHLIEKRRVRNRRGDERRKPSDRRDEDMGPLGVLKAAEDLAQASVRDRRQKCERLRAQDRRKKVRRSTDS
jgi:hypothetical protein